jgi:hypothetical protein
MTFRDIIALFGSPDKLALQIGVNKHAARNWRIRDHIPDGYWLDVIRAAKVHGHVITTDQLARLAEQARERATSNAQNAKATQLKAGEGKGAGGSGRGDFPSASTPRL